MTITPARRGQGANKANSATDPDDRTCMERRASMTWAQQLKRVFNIDIITCSHCQGPVKIIACIKDPVVIERRGNTTPAEARFQGGLRQNKGLGKADLRSRRGAIRGWIK